MLNIGAQELLLILLVALLVVGPRRLPELGRSLGKGIRELRKAQDEVRKTIQVNLDEEDRPTYQRRREGARTDEPGRERRPAAGETERATGRDVAADAAEPPVDASTGEVREVSRTLGRGLAELRRAREEIQRSFRVEVDTPASRGRAKTPPAAKTPPTKPPAADRAEPAGPDGGDAPE